LQAYAGAMDMLTMFPCRDFHGLVLPLCGQYQLVPWIHWLAWSMVSGSTVLQMVVGLTPTEQVCLTPAQEGMQAQVRPTHCRPCYRVIHSILCTPHIFAPCCSTTNT